MRRKFYLGFGIILLGILIILMMLHDLIWSLVIIIPLIALAMYDINQKHHAILRNFPILGHIRFILEFIRPEIRQYLIANDNEERPFDRETRSTIYQRSKGEESTIPFGTKRDIDKTGYEWVAHSLSPKQVSEISERITVGGPDCKQPYQASRLNISAMSFGALSANAILAMNMGAQLGGFAHNTGEGGLSDYHLAGGGDIIWQIGTGYFGCRDEQGNFDPETFKERAKHPQVKMIEIKLSQGAKPSHGGILPAAKITPEIARIRKVPMGQDVISPPAHSAFNTPTELCHYIQQLRELTDGKPIGFKICIGHQHEFFGICKAMLETQIFPDFITVDGAEGGTGAAPLEYTNHMGTALIEGLIFVSNALIGIGVRDHIKIICSGKITTGFDIISKLCLGADLCNSARAMMMATGCIQSLQCNLNTCPTGVATQDPRLQKGLIPDEKKYRVANYHQATIHSFLEIVGAMGLNDPSDLQRHHLMRRVSDHVVHSYDHIYPCIKPKVLLETATVPKCYATDWERASSAHF